MSPGLPPIAIAPGMALPVAHLGGWLWLAYLVPVLIVVVPLIRSQIDARKEKESTATKARNARR